MTEQPAAPPPEDIPPPPPPPPGNYPPPPPSAGGYAPPPPGLAIRGLPPQAYTSWFTRVLAAVIDHLPSAIVVFIGWEILVGTQVTACATGTFEYGIEEVCATGFSPAGWTVFWWAVLLALAYLVWNYGYRQGTTGSSIGNSVMKFKVVSERTGQPIGFGLSVVRQLAHIVDTIIFYIGYLFPLWDAKRQTLADKIMNTVCLPVQ